MENHRALDPWAVQVLGMADHLRARGWRPVFIFRGWSLSPVGMFDPAHRSTAAANDNNFPFRD